MVTCAPSRAAATAWLAPLPPAWVAKFVPNRVSPGRGNTSVATTRSMFKLPTTNTLDIAFSGVHLRRMVTPRREEILVAFC